MNIGNEGVRLYTDNMIFYVENWIESTLKLFELSEFSKFIGYKINIKINYISLHLQERNRN